MLVLKLVFLSFCYCLESNFIDLIFLMKIKKQKFTNIYTGKSGEEEFKLQLKYNEKRRKKSRQTQQRTWTNQKKTKTKIQKWISKLGFHFKFEAWTKCICRESFKHISLLQLLPPYPDLHLHLYLPYLSHTHRPPL